MAKSLSVSSKRTLQVLVIDNYDDHPPRRSAKLIKDLVTHLSGRTAERRKIAATAFFQEYANGSPSDLFTEQFKAVSNRYDLAVGLMFPQKNRNHTIGNRNGFWLKCGFWSGRRSKEDLLIARHQDTALPSNLDGADHLEVGNVAWWDTAELGNAIYRKVKQTLRNTDSTSAARAPCHARNATQIAQIKRDFPVFENWEEIDFLQAGYSERPYATDLIVPLLGTIRSSSAISAVTSQLINYENWLEGIASTQLDGADEKEIYSRAKGICNTLKPLPSWVGPKSQLGGRIWYEFYAELCGVAEATIGDLSSQLKNVTKKTKEIATSPSGDLNHLNIPIVDLKTELVKLVEDAEHCHGVVSNFLTNEVAIIRDIAAKHFRQASESMPRDLLRRVRRYHYDLDVWLNNR